jgi:acyl-CoA hydrolase
MTGVRLASLLRPGDRIVLGNGSAEPDTLIAALIEATRGFAEPVRLIQVTTGSREALVATAHSGLRLASPAPGPATRRAIQEGRADLLVASVGQLARWIAAGEMQVDGVLFQAGPRDGDAAWPGLSLDLVQPAFERARFRAVEVNQALPRLSSPWRPPLSRCELVLPVESPPRPGAEEAGEGSAAIASGIADMLPAGATLELGIGRAAGGLAIALRGRGGFALHTGLITDEVRRLVELGIVDRPPVPALAPALVVGSVLRGSTDLYRWADRNKALRLEDACGTHDVRRLAGLPRFVAVNGALQVDLHGNANGLVAGRQLIGGLGGAMDYAAAGANAAGSIIALGASTRRGAPRIVPRVECVTIPGLYVTHLVTEHGTARLAGLSAGERARAIIGLAAPDGRDTLRHAARQLGLC